MQFSRNVGGTADDGIRDAQPPQYPHAVRVKPDSRANFAEFGGLLVQDRDTSNEDRDRTDACPGVADLAVRSWLHSPPHLHNIRGDFQFAAERFQVRTRSGFRDVHASEGSNRA